MGVAGARGGEVVINLREGEHKIINSEGNHKLTLGVAGARGGEVVINLRQGDHKSFRHTVPEVFLPPSRGLPGELQHQPATPLQNLTSVNYEYYLLIIFYNLFYIAQGALNTEGMALHYWK